MKDPSHKFKLIAEILIGIQVHDLIFYTIEFHPISFTPILKVIHFFLYSVLVFLYINNASCFVISKILPVPKFLININQGWPQDQSLRIVLVISFQLILPLSSLAIAVFFPVASSFHTLQFLCLSPPLLVLLMSNCLTVDILNQTIFLVYQNCQYQARSICGKVGRVYQKFVVFEGSMSSFLNNLIIL